MVRGQSRYLVVKEKKSFQGGSGKNKTKVVTSRSEVDLAFV